MKYLPPFTAVLWIAIVSCYVFARSFLLQPWVLFPAYTLLCVFVPICFWTLQFEKKRAASLIFIAIFVINGSALSSSFFSMFIEFSKIEPFESLVLNSEQANRIYTGKDEQTRMNMSRYLYERSGVQTAYTLDSGELAVYSPTELDKSTLLFNMSRHYKALRDKGLLKYYCLGIFLLLLIQILTFIGILTYLILLEGPGGRASPQRSQVPTAYR